MAQGIVDLLVGRCGTEEKVVEVLCHSLNCVPYLANMFLPSSWRKSNKKLRSFFISFFSVIFPPSIDLVPSSSLYFRVLFVSLPYLSRLTSGFSRSSTTGP